MNLYKPNVINNMTKLSLMDLKFTKAFIKLRTLLKFFLSNRPKENNKKKLLKILQDYSIIAFGFKIILI